MRESNVLPFPAPTAKPGLYLRGQLDYEQIDAVNQSTLKEILRSPRHYLHRLQNPKPTTAPMTLGTFAHTAVLEPSRIALQYAVWEEKVTDPDTGRETTRQRRGKDWDAFKAANAGKTLVRACEVADAMAMRDAVAMDPMARHYLRGGKGTNETACVWVEPTTKTVCKSRFDRVAVLDGYHYVVDLKGVPSADPRTVAKQCANLGYHFQAAFYCDAYEVVTGHKPLFVIVAVEMKAPYDAAVYQLDESDLDKGRNLYREALELLAECQRTKVWPGVSKGMVQPLKLPDWAPGGAADEDALSLVIGGESVEV